MKYFSIKIKVVIGVLLFVGVLKSKEYIDTKFNSNHMGVILVLRTKNKHIELIEKNMYTSFSKEFDSFIDLNSIGETNEFDQVEKILDIDLSLFREKSNNTEPDIGYLDFKKYEAEEEGNQKEADSLQVEIDKIIEQWELDYPNDLEGWIPISDLRQLVNDFLGKIKATPHYYTKMEFNLNWEYYFNPDKLIKSNQVKPRHNHLITDLNATLDYLDTVESFGCELVTFEYQ